MPIRLRCPGCNAKLSIANRKAGQTIKCPGCGEAIAVPADESAQAPPAKAPAAKKPVTVGELWEADDPEDDEGGISFRKADSDFEEMDLTPMVDVTFLLLIFFMITASFTIQKILAYPPPDPNEEGAALKVQKLDDLKQDSIIVEIDENNQIVIDDQSLPDRSQLLSQIERTMRADNKNEIVIVRHYLSSHQTTVEVIDAAMTAGLQKIRTAIKPGTKPSG